MVNKIIDQYTDLPINKLKRWRLRHPDKIKEYNETHKEYKKEYMKNYGEKNKEGHNKACLKYRLTHKEQAKNYAKQYRENHKEEHRDYYQRNNERIKEQYHKWVKMNPDKGRKYTAKRKRNLGYIEINNYFVGSEGHHLTKEYVIYIPKKLHRSVYHNILTGYNMNLINFEVLKWYYGN
jgi:hypothetical protein